MCHVLILAIVILRGKKDLTPLSITDYAGCIVIFGFSFCFLRYQHDGGRRSAYRDPKWLNSNYCQGIGLSAGVPVYWRINAPRSYHEDRWVQLLRTDIPFIPYMFKKKSVTLVFRKWWLQPRSRDVFFQTRLPNDYISEKYVSEFVGVVW